MRRVMRGTAGLLYTLGILASLTFGATQAFATKPPTCTITGNTTCLTQAECDTYCRSQGFEGGTCNLSNHCCFCAL